MVRRFPGCLAYLEARRRELECRKVTGGIPGERQFYRFGRPQNLTKFDSPKVVLSTLTREPRYAYADADVLLTGGGNGPYYTLRPCADAAVTSYYLLAVLNHPLSEAFLRVAPDAFRGGYYSHRKQFIENLPVPISSDNERAAIEALVGQLIEVLDATTACTPHQRTLRERQAEHLRAKIEISITALFGLSSADMDIIRAVPTPG